MKPIGLSMDKRQSATALPESTGVCSSPTRLSVGIPRPFDAGRLSRRKTEQIIPSIIIAEGAETPDHPCVPLGLTG